MTISSYDVNPSSERRVSARYHGKRDLRKCCYFALVSVFMLAAVSLFIGVIELLNFVNDGHSIFARRPTIGRYASLTERATAFASTEATDARNGQTRLLVDKRDRVGSLNYDDERVYCGRFLRKEAWTLEKSGRRHALCMDYDGTLVDSRLAFRIANRSSDSGGTSAATSQPRRLTANLDAWSKLNHGASMFVVHRSIVSYLLATLLKSNSYSELVVFVDRCSKDRSSLRRDIVSIGRNAIHGLERAIDANFRVRVQRSGSFDALWLLDARLVVYDPPNATYAFKNVTLLARFVLCCPSLGVPDCRQLMTDKIDCTNLVSANDRYLARCAISERCHGTRVPCQECEYTLSAIDRERIYEAAYAEDGVLANPSAYTVDRNDDDQSATEEEQERSWFERERPGVLTLPPSLPDRRHNDGARERFDVLPLPLPLGRRDNNDYDEADEISATGTLPPSPSDHRLRNDVEKRSDRSRPSRSSSNSPPLRSATTPDNYTPGKFCEDILLA